MKEIRFRCKDGKCYFVDNIKYENIEHFRKSIRFKKWIKVTELGLMAFDGEVKVKDIVFIWEWENK
ncbi:MAG: hypothetical protein ACRC68_04355 [Clostridium sp.]